MNKNKPLTQKEYNAYWDDLLEFINEFGIVGYLNYCYKGCEPYTDKTIKKPLDRLTKRC